MYPPSMFLEKYLKFLNLVILLFLHLIFVSLIDMTELQYKKTNNIHRQRQRNRSAVQ